MKIFKLLFLFLSLNTSMLIAQQKKEQIITHVGFKGDKIILNEKHAFNYSINNNHFIISDIENNEIITGDITSLGEGKFSSIITFIKENRQFSNSKIIGRNDLFFKLLENNTITKDFKINPEKLNIFFEKYNEL